MDASPTPEKPAHQPVLLDQALALLNIRPGLTWVDATVGGGGHFRKVCDQAGIGSTVIGIDRDNLSLSRIIPPSGPTTHLVHSNYIELPTILANLGISTVNGGILADLGVSSMQLDTAERGFSFMQDGPLDMRMDSSAKTTAADLINSCQEKELANIIYEYGEERLSRQIARRIIENRPLKTTKELADLVARVVRRPPRSKGGHRDISHPATRTFQALRIAVNDELRGLESFLKSAISLLEPGARLVVITFHSLEDRLVKQIFTQAALPCICPPRQPICTCDKRPELLIITRKPVVANEQEVLANTRSRSAKLRAAERMS